MLNRVLWVGKEPTVQQKVFLAQIFGDYGLTILDGMSASGIREWFSSGIYTGLVVNLSLDMADALIGFGMRPLWPVQENGLCNGFRQLKSVKPEVVFMG